MKIKNKRIQGLSLLLCMVNITASDIKNNNNNNNETLNSVVQDEYLSDLLQHVFSNNILKINKSYGGSTWLDRAEGFSEKFPQSYALIQSEKTKILKEMLKQVNEAEEQMLTKKIKLENEFFND